MPVVYTSRLPKIARQLPRIRNEIEEEGADIVKRSAQARVNVRTGRLQRAIHTKAEPEGVYVVAGDTQAFYGHFLEFGTTHHRAYPFLIPALEASKPVIEAIASKRLGDL